jgi:type II secretory pathway pseudopilin PulG
MSSTRLSVMEEQRSPRPSEAGFTLVEALIAIVVLVFGLIAVTNLLLVAATSNMVASQATAATTAASRVLDMLKTTSYENLVAGGNLGVVMSGATPMCAVALPASFECRDDVDGVGVMHVRWIVTPVAADARLTFIEVRSEGQGVFAAGRTLADFTTLRSCTDSTALGGCPAAP